MSKDMKKRIEQSRKEIRRHDYLYYVLNQPEIDDFFFIFQKGIIIRAY